MVEMEEKTTASMTATYTPSLEDYYAHYKYHQSRRKFWQRTEFVLILALALYFIYFVVKPGSKAAESNIFLLLGIPAVLCLLLYGAVFQTSRDAIKRNFKAMQKQTKDQQSSGVISITITPEALFLHTDISDERHLWKLIQSVGQANGYGYLSLNKHSAFIIPARAFADKVQFEQFMHTALQYFEASR